MRGLALHVCFVVDDSFGNTEEKHFGFPNVYKYNMVQTVKQAVQNHVTPAPRSLLSSDAFATYSPILRRLQLPAYGSGLVGNEAPGVEDGVLALCSGTGGILGCEARLGSGPPGAACPVAPLVPELLCWALRSRCARVSCLGMYNEMRCLLNSAPALSSTIYVPKDS